MLCSVAAYQKSFLSGKLWKKYMQTHSLDPPPPSLLSPLNTHHVATTLSQVQSPDSSALNSSDIKDLKSRRSDLFFPVREEKKQKTAALLSLRCTIRGIYLKMSASTHSCHYFCSSCQWPHVCILKISLIFFLGKCAFMLSRTPWFTFSWLPHFERSLFIVSTFSFMSAVNCDLLRGQSPALVWPAQHLGFLCSFFLMTFAPEA